MANFQDPLAWLNAQVGNNQGATLNPLQNADPSKLNAALGGGGFSAFQLGLNKPSDTPTVPTKKVVNILSSAPATAAKAKISKGINVLNTAKVAPTPTAPTQDMSTIHGGAPKSSMVGNNQVNVYPDGFQESIARPIGYNVPTAPGADTTAPTPPAPTAPAPVVDTEYDTYLKNSADDFTKNAIAKYEATTGQKLSGQILTDFIGKQAEIKLMGDLDVKNKALADSIKTTYDKQISDTQEQQKKTGALETTGLSNLGIDASMLQSHQQDRLRGDQSIIDSMEAEKDMLVKQAELAMSADQISAANEAFTKAQTIQTNLNNARLSLEQNKRQMIQDNLDALRAEREKRYMTVGTQTIDTATDKVISDTAKTPDEKNYNLYSQQETEAGNTPKTFEEWMQQKASKPQYFTDSAGAVTRYDPVTGESTSLGDIGKVGTSATMTPDDIKTLAEGVMNGTIPPDLKGLYKYGGSVRAELAKLGFDLTTASNQYLATQKYITSANSTAQVRMKQAEGSVENSLGNLKSINDDFVRTGFKFANRAELNAAANGLMEGVYPGSREKAQQLIGQISLITDELGQTFMGGNSPTDAAFGLAAKVLSADFSQDTLNSQIDLISKNLQYRKNSWNQVSPTTASPDTINPYANPAPADDAASGDSIWGF